jgi:hypothetical protein
MGKVLFLSEPLRLSQLQIPVDYILHSQLNGCHIIQRIPSISALQIVCRGSMVMVTHLCTGARQCMA